MPTGKVKWYDAEKGFGFLSREDGDDVYVRSSSLPEGVATSRPAPGSSSGSSPVARASRPTRCRCSTPRPRSPRTVATAQRKKPEEMVGIVEDLIRLLEGVETATAPVVTPTPRRRKPTAKLLRGLADELEL